MNLRSPVRSIHRRRERFPLSSFEGSAEAFPTISMKAAAQIAVDNDTVSDYVSDPDARQTEHPSVNSNIS